MTISLLGSVAGTLLGFLMGFLSLFLVMLILIQRGKGGGLTGALGGPGGQSAFGSKAGDTFTAITIGVALTWGFTCAFTMWLLGSHASTPVAETSISPGPDDQDADIPVASPDSENAGLGGFPGLGSGLEGDSDTATGETPSVELTPANPGTESNGDSSTESSDASESSDATESSDASVTPADSEPSTPESSDTETPETNEETDAGETEAGGAEAATGSDEN